MNRIRLYCQRQSLHCHMRYASFFCLFGVHWKLVFTSHLSMMSVKLVGSFTLGQGMVPGPARLRLARAAAFTSMIWTRLESEV